MTPQRTAAQKYSINQPPIDTLLTWVQSGEIAIPEIQRPFVWKSSKVRDLMDSLYKGYPIGYVITWRNPNVNLKDGSSSAGKKVLIDGQQRITALTAAILGQYVVNSEYQRVRIKIAFHPVQERFEVQTPIIRKNPQWIPDISEALNGSVDAYTFIEEYRERNPDLEKTEYITAITELFKLTNKQIGVIELASDLDIETVTEIFIRINSKGVVLSQADFAMSKIASNEAYQGQLLRKAIDYFCHLAVAPEFYTFIRDNDPEFAQTTYFQKMGWLRNETEDLYDPDYKDMLRVSFGLKFKRAKIADLVSLLSGRNFETRTFEEHIAEDSFRLLSEGVLTFMSETEFKRFLMIIRSAGFVSPKMIRSKNAINFAYLLYLTLRDKGLEPATIESYVRRWFVLMILTGRSSGSFESQFDFDIKQIAEKDFGQYLKEVESAELSDAFWTLGLPQALESSVISSPVFQVFLAAQVKAKDRGLLSSDVRVEDLIALRGDIHHIFPRAYLKKHGMGRSKYNQIANFAYTQQEVNIKIGSKSPAEYFALIQAQVTAADRGIGGITTMDTLEENLRENCMPISVMQAAFEQYEEFLQQRRALMAAKIHQYYLTL